MVIALHYSWLEFSISNSRNFNCLYVQAAAARPFRWKRSRAERPFLHRTLNIPSGRSVKEMSHTWYWGMDGPRAWCGRPRPARAVHVSGRNYISCNEKSVVDVLYKQKQKTRKIVKIIWLDSNWLENLGDSTRLDSTRSHSEMTRTRLDSRNRLTRPSLSWSA